MERLLLIGCLIGVVAIGIIGGLLTAGIPGAVGILIPGLVGIKEALSC